MDRDEVQTSIFTIDVRNEFADLPLKLGRVRQGGRGDLDHDNIANPLREILEELLKRAKLRNTRSASPSWPYQEDSFYLLDDTFHNIELVTSNNDLLAFVQRA